MNDNSIQLNFVMDYNKDDIKSIEVFLIHLLPTEKIKINGT